MSIMPPDSDRNSPSPASLRGVAHMMTDSADPFTTEVGRLIEYIAWQHEPTVCCDECRSDDRDPSYPCLMQESATSVAFAWLRRVIEERG